MLSVQLTRKNGFNVFVIQYDISSLVAPGNESFEYGQISIYRDEGLLQVVAAKKLRQQSGTVVLSVPHAGRYVIFNNYSSERQSIDCPEGVRAATTSGPLAVTNAGQCDLVAPSFNTWESSDRKLVYSVDTSCTQDENLMKITLEGGDTVGGFSTMKTLYDLVNGITGTSEFSGEIDCSASHKKYYRIRFYLHNDLSNQLESLYSPIAATEQDTTPPQLSVTAIETVTVGDTYKEISYSDDNSGGAAVRKQSGETVSNTNTGGLSLTASGTVDTTTAGTYPRSWTATDAAGNVTTITKNIVVQSAPVQPSPPTLDVNCTETLTVGDTFHETATAADSSGNTSVFTDGSLTTTEGGLTITATGTVNTTVAGTYPRTWAATDAADNTTTVTKNIVVTTPEQPPEPPPPKPPENAKQWTVKQSSATGRTNHFIIEWANADLSDGTILDIGSRDLSTPPKQWAGYTEGAEDYQSYHWTNPAGNNGAAWGSSGNIDVTLNIPGKYQFFFRDKNGEITLDFKVLDGPRFGGEITKNWAWHIKSDENGNIEEAQRCNRFRSDPGISEGQTCTIEITNDLDNIESYELGGETTYQQMPIEYRWDSGTQSYSNQMSDGYPSNLILSLLAKDTTFPDPLISRKVDEQDGTTYYGTWITAASTITPLDPPRLVLIGKAYYDFNDADEYAAWTDPGVRVVNGIGTPTVTETTKTNNYSTSFWGTTINNTITTRTITYSLPYTIGEGDSLTTGTATATRSVILKQTTYYDNGTGSGFEISMEYADLIRISGRETGLYIEPSGNSSVEYAVKLTVSGTGISSTRETVVFGDGELITVSPNAVYAFYASDGTHYDLKGGLHIEGGLVTAQTAGIALSWPAATGATSYNIYRSVDGYNWALIAENQTETGYTDTSVTENVRYWYGIAANSNISDLQTDDLPHGITTNVCTLGSGVLRTTRPIRWNDSNVSPGHYWYRAALTDGLDTATTNTAEITLPTMITWADTSPATGQSWYRATLTDGLDTVQTNADDVTITETPQPVQLPAPTITVTPHARYVEVAVTPVANAVNYTLMSSGTSTFEANGTHYDPDNTTGPYQIPFSPQTAVYLRAMALGDTTNYSNSEWGEAISTITLSLTPLNYPVVVWNNGVPTFSPVTGATAYRIRYHATDAALATTSEWITLVNGTKPAGLPDGTWQIQSGSIASGEDDYDDSPWGNTQSVTITSPENPVTNYFFIDGDNLKYLGNTPAGWYKVRVRSTDQNGGYYERDKYVRITPNSNPTDILLDNHVAHVSPSDARMGGLTTLDPDTSDTHTYSIVSETEVDADTTIPVLTLLGESNVQILKDSVWTDPGVTATDNYDDNISDNVVVTGTVNTGIAGTYVLTYSVTDFAGNAATTVNRTVVVRNADDILDSIPVIVLNGNSTVYLAKGSTWTDPGAVATDDNDGDITPQISVTGTVNTQTVGSYALTYNVSDSSGNAAFPVTRTVMVIEQEGLPDVPSLTLTGSSTVYHPKGLTWTDPGAAATDSDNTDLTSSIVVSGTVNVNVVGTYTLTYSVTNSSNVTVRQTRTVIVENTADFDAVAISNSVIRITLPTATLQQVWLRRRVYNPQGEWATILNGTAAKTFDDSTADSNGPSPNIVYEYQYSIDGTNWTGSENAWLTDVIHYGAITEVYGNTNSELNLLKVGDSGVFYARIFNVLTGTPIVPEDISSITYTVQKRSMSLRTVTWTNVTNFTNVSVPVFPTILESCIMTDLWTADSQGFNFVHSPDTRTTDLFTTEGVYRVQYRLVPVSGNPVNLVFTVLVE